MGRVDNTGMTIKLFLEYMIEGQKRKQYYFLDTWLDPEKCWEISK